MLPIFIAKRVWSCLALLPFVSANVLADDLIDRFAALDTVWTAEIAPDGKHLALGCTRKGARAACVYELDAVGKAPSVFSAAPDQRLIGISWAGPEWLVLALNMTDDLRGKSDNLALIPVSRSLAINILTGENSSLLGKSNYLSTNLTDIAAIPAGSPAEVFMRSYYVLEGVTRDSRIKTKDSGWRTAVGVYRVSLKTGAGKLVQRSDVNTATMLVNSLGVTVARVDFDRDAKRYAIYRIVDGRHEKVFERYGVSEPSFDIFGVAEDGRKLAVGAYGDDGVYRSSLIDLRSGEVEKANFGTANVDGASWISAKNSDVVVGVGVGVVSGGDAKQQRFSDERLQNAWTMLSGALPDKGIAIGSWSEDRSLVTLSAAGLGEPPSYYLFDADKKSLSPVGQARPELAKLTLSVPTRVTYAARDGLKIEAILTLPLGKTDKDGPFPLLLFPHGGPLAHDDASFDWWASYFSQRGYAVLQPNFRGSSGYGLAFREKGYGEFGGAMIDDVIDGAKHLIAGGVVDANRICAMGASYGGYASLMVPLRDASLVKCVAAVAAVTDPTTIIGERIKLYGKDSGVIEHWEDYMGSRYRDAAAIAAASPQRSAAAIKVPVLLLHGTDDINVPVGQSRSLKKQMQSAGRDVRLVEFVGDDHYLNTTAVRKTLLTEIDAFLTTHIPPSK